MKIQRRRGEFIDCPNCNGTGKVFIDEFNSNRGHYESVGKCGECGGEGVTFSVVIIDDEEDNDA